MDWTPEQKELATSMIMEGCSTLAIMGVMGLTRGQVCGFARRNGLKMTKIQQVTTKPLPPTPVVHVEHREHVPIAPIPPRIKHPVVEAPVKPLTIMELNGDTCKWMLNKTHYCGAPTVINGKKLYSWCPAHYKIVFRLEK